MKRNQRWTARILTILMVIQMMLGPGPALLNNRTYAAAALPAGWSNQDIGSATAVGSADFSNGIYTIKGAGADIGGSSDSMQYVYQPVTGDCAIIARISSQQNTNSLAKAGVMIRDSLTANAKFAAALATPSKRIYYEWRTTAGGSASSSNVSAAVPRYLKVQRKGTIVSAYQSSNGTTWSQVGSNRTVSMGSTVYVGLAVSSHLAGTLSQAVFDNVQIQYLTPPVVPANITATPANTSNTITWSAVSNASSYEIEVDGSVVSNGNNTSYIHNNLTPDTQHQYRVRAKNTGGTSAWSAYVASRTLPNPPSAPENLRVTSVNASTISIAWDASAGATGYDIEIDGTAADNGTLMSYTHGNLQPSTQHTYKVRAKNAGGSSAWTSMMTASTLPNPPQVPANVVALATHSSITVSWEAASGADGYDIEADGTIIDNNASTTYVHNDLTPDSQHIYRVRARNTGGMSDWSTAITKRTLPNVPVAPINIYTVPAKNEIQVNWDPVSGAEGYEIEVDGNVISNGANTSYTHTNLQANTAHTYRVRSINAGGTGEWSVTKDETTLPDAPAVPVIVQSESTTATITITWDPVADAAGYDIEADGVIIDNGSSLSYTDINLQPNTQHHYRIRGRNAGGVGEWSEEVVKSTLIEVPGTPANVSASSTTTTITVTWDTEPNAIGYDIEVDGQVIDNGTNTSYTHMDLLPETQHVYRVRAKNDGGPGEWSAAIEKKTLQEIPGVPANIAFAANNTSITITWDAVANAVGYDIEADGTIIDNGMETSYLHDGLTPNTQHTYRVRTKNPAGPGPWSNIETVSTVQETIGIPGNLSATAAIDSISITWNAVAGATGYDIEADGTIIDNGNTTGYTHTPLAANTAHNYRVRAKSAAVIGEWSETISKSTLPVTPSVPEVPANLQATSATNTITLTWDAVTGATGYEVDADGTVVEATGTSYAHNNLQPNTSHTYKVRSKNAGGASAWSAAITKSTLPDLPAVPTNIVTAVSSDSITVTWDAVQGATGYEIEADGTVIGVTGTSYVHSNLQTGSSHTYKVRTLNAGRAGAWSNPVTATIAPAMNTDLKAVTDGNSNITVTWSPIEGATGYDIEVDGAVKDNGTNTSYVHTGLSANVIHTYRIRAKGPTGAGSWSNPVSKAVMTIIDGGTISQDTTWDNVGSPYIVNGSITILENISLNVVPGTEVKTFIGRRITVNGKLVAVGTASDPITFTCSHPRETEYWDGIYISSTGELNADHIRILRSGLASGYVITNGVSSYGKISLANSEVNGSQGNGVVIYSNETQPDMILKNNIITGSRGDGLVISHAGSGVLDIEGNTLANNGGYGLVISKYAGSVLTLDSNTVTGNGSGSININMSNFVPKVFDGFRASNTISGLVYFGGGTLPVSMELPKNQYILGDSLTIPEGKTLTIVPGTEVKTFIGRRITVNGKLVVVGTASDPITFTCSHPRETEYWDGIYISSTGELNADHIRILRSGLASGYVITNGVSSYGKISLTNSEVNGSAGTGIAIYSNISSGTKIVNNIIKDCRQYAIYTDTLTQPTIAYNTFQNNYYGIYNNQPTLITINAQRNYWGSVYGPSWYHKELRQWIGYGEKVSDGVDFYNWLGQASQIESNYGKTYSPTGNHSYQNVDMSVKAPGYQLDFGRTYNSLDTQNNGLFGKGWTFSYECSIKTYTEAQTLGDGSQGQLTIVDVKQVSLPDGKKIKFKGTDATQYVAEDNRNKLAKTADGYELTTKDQYKYLFNANGYLYKITDRHNNIIDITVAANGKIVQIKDSVGRVFTITYNTAGNIETIYDQFGHQITYQYDNGKLVKVIDPKLYETTYGYDAEGFLSVVKNKNQEIVEQVTYDHAAGVNQHKIKTLTDEYGNVKTYSHDTINYQVIITDSNGRQTIEKYDALKSITTVIDPETKQTVPTYNLENGVNKYNEIKSVKDRDGNTTTYDYDARGNVTKITNPDGSFKLMEYDAKDNLIATCDESNNWIVYQYDANGVNVQKKAEAFAPGQKYAAGANDNNFKITSYDYFSNGLVKTITVKNGSDNYSISFTYDSYGNIDTITDSRGKITDENYNEVGWKTNTKSPLGFVTSYNYDNNGNLQTIQKSKDTAGSSFATTSFAYDAEGNKTKEVQPKQYVQASGAVGTRYTYYPSGEVNTVTDAEGNPTTYTYDLYGNVETETKPSGAIYRNEYDVMNRLVKVYFRANAGAPEKLLTENTYSVITGTPFNKTKKIEKQHLNDTEVAITEYTYDYAVRLIAQKNPDGTTKSAVFNKNGTLQTVTDEKGLVSKYNYDGLGNMTESWVPTDKNETVQYTYTKIEYDPAGRKTAEKVGQGRVAMDTAVTSFIATKSYTYWPDGKTKTVSLNGKLIKEYSYDDDGNLNKEITYMAENDKIEVSYDNNYLGKPIKISKAARAGDLDGNDFADNSIVAIDTVLDYDDNGNLSYQKTPLGIETFYAYDNLNRQTEERKQVEDENGNLAEAKTTKTYTWDGQVKTITDARNNTTIYDYDSEGNLINVTDAKVGVTAYYYDLAGRRIAEVRPESNVTGKTLAEMNRTEYTYDLMDRIKLKTEKYVDPKTNQWVTVVVKAYKYDQFGKVIKELDALGYKTAVGATPDEKINNGYGTEYTYTESGLTKTILDPETKAKGAQFTSKISYDTLDRKTDETNAKGVTTTYGYDDFGNIVSVKVKSSTTPERTIQSASYDYTGNILSKTDGNGNTINYLYNALGEVRKAIYPGDSTIAEKTEQYQYDKDGNLKKQWDDTGKEVQYTYDRTGRQLSWKEQKQDGTEAISTSVRYDLNGNKRYSIDAKGNTTENTYDALNRLETVTITVSGKTKRTTYDYDKDGNLKKETDWLGNGYTYNYDPLDRLTEKKDATDKTIQKLEYNETGAQVKSFDALEHKTEYQYDKNNRLLATIDPKTHTTSQTYDLAGNISTKTDGRTNTTTYVYDELNRLQSVINAKTETTSFTYDLNGNMLTQENGRGYVTTMEYNVANKLVRRIDHGGRTGTPGSYTYNPDKTETYSYYADGSLKTKTDRNGITTTYTYDIHGRLLSQVTDNIHISYTYDNNGNQLTMTDGTGTTTRTYDEQNRVLTKQVPLIGLSTYTYDIIENIPDGFVGESTSDPKGNTTLKVYDKNGRLKYVTADGKTTTYNYDDNGNRESVVNPDGSTETYTYELDNLLKTLVNKKAGDIIIDTYTYEYDGAHNLTSKVDAKGTTIYTYDALNRLETVAEPGGKNTVYTFDAAGNRQTEVTVSGANSTANTYYYNEQNRLAEINTKLNGTTIQTTGYTYDNNGNQLTSEVIDYAGGVAQAPKQTLNIYDKLNQLLATTTAGKTVTNKYNGDGLRVEKNSNGQTTRYLYEYDKVVLEVNEQGAQTAKNIYGTNLLVRNVNGQTAYYMYNGHGDVTVLLGTAGQELARYYYDAFGNVLESSGNINNPIRYAGYQYDEETGLYYLNARMYDPVTARFMQEDTYKGDTKDPLSLNLYTYCHNEPLMYDDPTGHFGEKATLMSAKKAKAKRDNANSYGPENGRLTVMMKTYGPQNFGQAFEKAYKDTLVTNKVKLIKQLKEKPVETYLAVAVDCAKKGDSMFTGGYEIDRARELWGNLIFGKKNKGVYIGEYYGEESAEVTELALTYKFGDVLSRFKIPFKTPKENNFQFMKSPVINESGQTIVDTLPSFFKGYEGTGGGNLPVLYDEGFAILQKQRGNHSQIFKTGGIEEQLNYLENTIPGFNREQGRYLLESAYKRDSSVVFGGSRVRGNYTNTSDLDVGFGNLSKAQARKVLKGAGNFENGLPIEDTLIVPGNETANISKIISPEEFFQRFGIRSDLDSKAGKPFYPSGSITVTPDGGIKIIPPGGVGK